MIIRCHSCTQRYYLDDDVIGSQGKKVRCTSCGKIWHQSLPETGKNQLILLPFPALTDQRQQVPVKKSSGFLFYGSIILFISSFVVCLLLANKKKLNQFFLKYTYLLPTHSLPTLLTSTKPKKSCLEILSLMTEPAADGNGIVLKGKIFNPSQALKSVPNLVISFIKNGSPPSTLKKFNHSLSSTILLPKETLYFHIPISSPPRDFSFVMATF